MFKGAHIVQAIDQLDQHDPDIFDHREEHFSIGLSLARLATLVSQPVDFGHPIDQFGDFVTELSCDIGVGCRRVFDDVVKQPGSDRSMVHPQLG